jgi:hypothetical protein
MERGPYEIPISCNLWEKGNICNLLHTMCNSFVEFFLEDFQTGS